MKPSLQGKIPRTLLQKSGLRRQYVSVRTQEYSQCQGSFFYFVRATSTLNLSFQRNFADLR